MFAKIPFCLLVFTFENTQKCAMIVGSYPNGTGAAVVQSDSVNLDAFASLKRKL